MFPVHHPPKRESYKYAQISEIFIYSNYSIKAFFIKMFNIILAAAENENGSHKSGQAHYAGYFHF